MLYQLSYTPDRDPYEVVGLGRFELPTSRLSGVRSNQLSYRPVDGRAATDAGVRHECPPEILPIPWKLNRDVDQRLTRIRAMGTAASRGSARPRSVPLERR